MLVDDPAPLFKGIDELVDQLGTVLTVDYTTHEQIDDALRSYLSTAGANHEVWQGGGGDKATLNLARCTTCLLQSSLYVANREYVRRQIIYCILQDDNLAVLHLTAAILLRDGREDLETFQMMQEEGTFSRLADLLRSREYDDTALHKLLLDLLCEMSRIQRLSIDDLDTIDDAFVLYLFELIEQHADDVEDPYHYAVIRLLLVMNEQYMCADSDPEKTMSAVDPGPHLSNRIVAVLAQRGPVYRTFGENLILLLNRERGLGPQLLLLKMLYLLFTNPSTFEYFYTNDLYVLVDVIIRNLLDLDTGSETEEDAYVKSNVVLRHTYLRVLHPLLRNTQLALPGSHYKREELRKLFYLMANPDSLHFAPVDETVMRLVTRCKQVDWIADPMDIVEISTPASHVISPTSNIDESTVTKNRMLGMQLAEQGVSDLSIAGVAAHTEKRAPAIPPPRRRGKLKMQEVEGDDGLLQLKVPPPSCRTAETRARSPFAGDVYET